MPAPSAAPSGISSIDLGSEQRRDRKYYWLAATGLFNRSTGGGRNPYRQIAIPAHAGGRSAAEFHEAAARLFETEKPDWVHFHTFGLTEAALAKLAKHGIPYAFTYHSPAWTCRRVTMPLTERNRATEKCGAWRCSACQSEQRLGMVYSPATPRRPSRWRWDGRLCLWEPIYSGVGPHLLYDSARFSRVLRRFLAECDLVVSCCDWSGPVLRLNGARENCLVQCPQGVPNDIADALRENSELRTPNSDSELTLWSVTWAGWWKSKASIS